MKIGVLNMWGEKVVYWKSKIAVTKQKAKT